MPSDSSAALSGLSRPCWCSRSPSRPAALAFHGEAAAGEGQVDGVVQRGGVAGLADRLQRGGDVCPVVAHHRRPRADLAGAGGRGGVGPDVVVEPPGPDLLAHPEHLGGLARIGELAEHAVVRADLVRPGPGAAIAADADDAVIPLAQHRRGPQQRAVPYALPLDLRVKGERALAPARGEAEVDGVAELVTAEAEPQRYRLGAHDALYGVSPLAHGPPGRLGTRPERRRQAALPGKGGDRPVASSVGQQPQRPVQA